MNFDEYQVVARRTADYPMMGRPDEHNPSDIGSPGAGARKLSWVYPAVGFVGEAGEVTEKLKKVWRDRDGRITPDDQLALAKELGDALWYLANLAWELGLNLEFVAAHNLDKLRSRVERGTLYGDGDER